MRARANDRVGERERAITYAMVPPRKPVRCEPNGDLSQSELAQFDTRDGLRSRAAGCEAALAHELGETQ